MPDPVKTKIILRNGIENDRAGVVFSRAEPVYTTDGKKLYIGDGTTQGGIPIPNIDNTTLIYHPTSGTLGVNENLFSSYYKKDGTDDVDFLSKVNEVVALSAIKVAIGSDANNIITGTLTGDGKVNVDVTTEVYTKTINFSHGSLTPDNVTHTIPVTDRIESITVDKYGHVTSVSAVSADTIYDIDTTIYVGIGQYIDTIKLNKYGQVTEVVTYQTPTSPVLLNTALNVTVSSADISWVTSSNNNYECYIAAATGADFTTQSVLSSDSLLSYDNSIQFTTYNTLTGLLSGTEYYIRINDIDDNPKSNFITLTTL